ncbi:MAG: hypothetical protein A2X34_05260 [Elusimicrobia bacterium GWC2_51_8]|nr:MAG: hypothetical protein A2X33_05940 [Elusimicrobia bacterium GWA2_51_34]OGR58010.1 MAG: hypothetical protein A2X34_05260 [Elusimicrobia bacterium GWC2_51_8]OGR88186.1 MAG: hypothetical protein A2021_01080 [Elusimicrobia bacterium GWF2_52_66]HAF95390.1 radical SAM protein [Elusimicrobiota bacterium]HCE98745.1 radical SAM protein [Elusimicrobiota bacterium]
MVTGHNFSGVDSARENRLFCAAPFENIEIHSGGVVHICCTLRLPVAIGNITNRSIQQVWNSDEAQKIRKSVFDGSFKYCIRASCPFLQTISMHVKRIGDVTDPRISAVIKNHMLSLPYGPRQINCCFDRSCNLSCPSCRTRMFVDTDNKREILEIQRKIQELRDVEELYIEGSGDPLGSPFTREWLRSMRTADMPELKLIRLHTNGQLLTPEMWNTIPSDVRELIREVEISIDAASPETYHVNRRGGSFETLLQNLSFLGELRKSRRLERLILSMVVQENNFREMPAFVSLGRQFGATCVYFSSIHNWIFSETEFLRRAVHLSAHPRYPELAQLLKDNVFKDPIVFLGNLTSITKEA